MVLIYKLIYNGLILKCIKNYFTIKALKMIILPKYLENDSTVKNRWSG